MKKAAKGEAAAKCKNPQIFEVFGVFGIFGVFGAARFLPVQEILIQASTEDHGMTVLSLSELNLHDSHLLEVAVDRVNRDADRITLGLDYIEDYETMRTTKKRLIFSGCVRAVFDMNFKVATPDSVSKGFEVEPSAMLEATRATLGKVGLTLNKAVKHFRIETNTTGSVLDILAEMVELLHGEN